MPTTTHKIVPSHLLAVLLAPLALSAGCQRDASGAAEADERPVARVELTEQDKAGEHFKKGDRVKAPFGAATKKNRGKIIETYGKLAKIQFFDRHVGWANVKDLEPQGAIVPVPAGDECGFGVGDEIRAPWSYEVRYFKGTIDEVHGKVAHIKYADGDEDWMKCERIKSPKKVTKRAPRLAQTERSGGGRAEEVRQCQRQCNPSCRHVTAKATCVAKCRRRCQGKRF